MHRIALRCVPGRRGSMTGFRPESERERYRDVGGQNAIPSKSDLTNDILPIYAPSCVM